MTWDRDAFDQFCGQHGEDPSDGLIREIRESLFRYEDWLQQKNGKRQRATYVWRSLKQNGAIESLKRRVLKPGMSEGFKVLIDAGQADDTDECLVLRYRGRFPDKIVKAAERRLAKVCASCT
jgi:hypothetical protein